MGVIGLWGLLEPAGKPIPLESLENKILAVDVSIWLNQAVKGYRDREGNAVANAHLLGLFHRISKLLFYKIKPVFVFDGKAPDLKKETLQRRRIRKGDASKKARLASAKILDNFVRSQVVAGQLQQQTHAINKVLSKGQEGLQEVLNNRVQKRDKDLFELPPMPADHAAILADSDEDTSDDEFKDDLLRQLNAEDIHSMDVTSPQFAALPKEMQYEVLHELTERRKQSSWGKMNEMPKSGSGFSGFQMQRLINRSKVQKAKDNVGKEIGEENALQLDANLFVGDINGLKKAKAEAKKVASSSSGTHYLYVKDLKKAQETIDDEVEILEPLVLTSNRVGGSMTIKKEVIEEEDQEMPVSIKEPMPSTSTAQVVSESSENDDDFEEVKAEHMDVSESSSSDGEFEEVRSSVIETKKKGLEIEIGPPNALEKDDDLFADVFGDDNVEPPETEQTPTAEMADAENDPEPVNVEDPTENMAEKMKQSEHLYLKIAAKYVERPSTSAASEEVKASNDNVFDELDEETEKLLMEMKTKTREQRLLKIKDLDKMQAEETKKGKAHEVVKEDQKTRNILSDLGVEQMHQDDYTQNVMRESNLAENEETDQVFGDAAEGFVRSDRDSGVLDSSRAEILEKCDKEGEEFDRDELLLLQQQLAEEQQGLIAERGQLDRLAATVTDQMYGECQELLQLFGIPWLVAPSEAEAQCAFLDMNGLTHGTITDDSDVWVFGGQRVYKNFFNQDKHCEYFTAADVDKHFGLSREKLILLAMLTGSDYTDGIESVGPVTALEILAEFPGQGIEPLKTFKDWWSQVHKPHAMPPGTKTREKMRKLQVPETFPSERISNAYLNPDVDNSMEKFSWAIPNFVDIRDYATDKFGWPKAKIDEIIKPVIKKLGAKTSQERIDNFFITSRITLPDKGHYQSSKRVKEAISKVLGKPKDESQSSEPTKRPSAAAKKTKASKTSEKVSKAGEKAAQATFQVQPPKDWKKEDKAKQDEAKKKALEVLKSLQKKKKEKKPKVKRLQRKVLQSHNLSESDSD